MKNQTLTQLANQIVALRNKRQGGTLPSSHGSILPQDGCIVPQPLIYKSGGNTGAMIALFLPISTGIHFVQSDPKALAPNELHVTLAYLGKAADLSPRQIMETRGLMRLISENHPPLTGHINGCGRFYNDDDDGDPFFIIPDLPALPNLRQAIIDGLRGRDIDGAKDHGFTPHITLTYLPHDKRNPFDALEKIPISFETISLVLGDDRYDYPLTQYAPLLSKAALVEKIGARHTQNEATLIQKIHDLVLDLGGECHPLTRRAGARHSRGDQVMVQRIHDDCSGLGAVCKAMPKKDRVYGSQVLKERTKADPETLKRVRDYCGLNEVTKAQSDAPNYRPASTPQRCANCRFFLGDPGRDWCELFDFTADPDYVSEAWEPQRPNEIPGYVANKAELAELAERILILRGGRTSGNWGHAGRKGKRGGSGAGGGFGRIGIKPGANRKTIKRAAKKKQAKAKAKAKKPEIKKPQAKPKVAAKKPTAKPKPAAKKPAAKKRVAKEDRVPKVDKTSAGDVKDAKSTNNKQMVAAHKSWMENMSTAELDGLQTYQSSEFQNINGSLRGQEKATAANKKAIKSVDKVLARSPLKEDTVVFRSMDENTLKELLGSDMKKWTGQGYTDKGYTSTSIKPGGGFRGLDMEIRVPKGTPSGYLGNLPGGGLFAAKEQELLLGRGQKFRILKVKGGRRPKIIAEIIKE